MADTQQVYIIFDGIFGTPKMGPQRVGSRQPRYVTEWYRAPRAGSRELYQSKVKSLFAMVCVFDFFCGDEVLDSKANSLPHSQPEAFMPEGTDSHPLERQTTISHRFHL